jgi:hypothetical protein
MTHYFMRLHDLLEVALVEGWDLAEDGEDLAGRLRVSQGEEYLWRLLARIRKVRTLRLREMGEYVLFGPHAKVGTMSHRHVLTCTHPSTICVRVPLTWNARSCC